MNGTSTNVWVIAIYAVMALGLGWLIISITQPQGTANLTPDGLEAAFSSATGQFTLRLPAHWSGNVAEATEGLGVSMANSAAGLARFNDGLIQAGDVGVSVGLIPMAFFASDLFRRQEIKLDASPEALLASILPLMRLAGDRERKSLAGTPWRVTLANGTQAGMLTMAAGSREATVLAYPIAEGVLALVTAAGYLGEDQASQMALAIAGQLEFIGSAEEVAGAYFAN